MTSLIKAGIITASDRSSEGRRADTSGILLKSLAEELPAEVIAYQVFPDDKQILKKALCHMADLLHCDLILTTGGTGLGLRDHTPEATLEVIDKEIPGIPQAIREDGARKTPFAILSRAVAGVRTKTLIINLPGSPEAVKEAFELIRPVLWHAVELIHGEVADCRPFSSLSHSHSSLR